MSSTVLWSLAVVATGVLGLGIGVWAGGEIEQDAFIELLARGDLSPECQEEIGRAASRVVEDWEG